MDPSVVRWIRSPSAARLTLFVLGGAGLIWWIAVFASEDVRRLTLGGWSPTWLVGPDLCGFVGASMLAAIRASWRWAVLAAVWTVGVSMAVVAYSLWTRKAGWGAEAMVPCAVLIVAAAMTLRFGVALYRIAVCAALLRGTD